MIIKNKGFKFNFLKEEFELFSDFIYILI